MQFTGFQSNKFVRLATFYPAITFTSNIAYRGVQFSKPTFSSVQVYIRERRIMKNNTYLALFMRKSTATEDIFSFSLQKCD